MPDDEYEECEWSGLPKIYCAHCLGHKLGDEKDQPQYANLDPDDGDVEYEVIGRSFESRYRGHCTLVYDHVIKPGQKVARVQRRDNPMIPVAGVACSSCIRELPKART